MTIENKIKLLDGNSIPQLGFGTYLSEPDDCYSSVLYALECGYRHIDTAAFYQNEDAVGRAVRDSSLKREDIFVTTKLWNDDQGYDKTMKAFEKSYKALNLNYIDLYLIHWPCVEKVSPDWKEINAATWRAFEDAYKDGKIRAIGVSNFQKKHYDALAERCDIKPMVNQIEFHPGYTQPETVSYSREAGMLVQAFSPLGCGAVLGDETLASIAKKYNKTVAQICLRFVLQSGLNVLTKSVTPERIIENAQIFDFEISAEDMAVINAMPELGFTGWLPENAPADAIV
jgi:diketogulonate reductase-like aldo/keto reductase